MRTTHLRQADLNLLVVRTAVAEERNITRRIPGAPALTEKFPEAAGGFWTTINQGQTGVPQFLLAENGDSPVCPRVVFWSRFPCDRKVLE